MAVTGPPAAPANAVVTPDAVVTPARSLSPPARGVSLPAAPDDAIRPVKRVPHRPAPAHGILKQPSKAPASTAGRLLASAQALAFRPVGEGGSATLAGWRGALGRWTKPVAQAAAGASRSPVPANAPATVASSSLASPAEQAATAGPSQPPPLSVRSLRSVRFTMSTLTVVYPINGTGALAPSDEADTRDRVESEYAAALSRTSWNGRQLELFYNTCCRSREERGTELVRATLREAGDGPVRTLDLADQPFTLPAAEALGDLLSVDFGLRKLVLAGCSLDDESLKPLLHALLVSGGLPTLSLANNKRIRAKGFRYLAIFLRKALFLRFLDLSENSLDKRTVDLLVQALGREADSRAIEGRGAANGDATPAADRPRLWPAATLLRDEPSSTESTARQLNSLRLENCGLKIPALESLAHGIRTSGVKHISLRRNRITSHGAVALAIMLRDFEGSSLVVPDGSEPSPAASVQTSPQLAPVADVPRDGSNSVTARQQRTLPPPLPPPKRVTNAPVVPLRPNDAPRPNDADHEEDAAFGTERRPILAAPAPTELGPVGDRVLRQIESLPRISALVTLDVRSNDIREGVVYIAQALKRNRTLRILNLSDNRVDSQGLAAIAEALRLNTVLETLDMSGNPCCGPTLEGIAALRTTFAQNTSLVRVFLNGTDLRSEGAISLAEFLPDIKTLLHLDLTENYEIDIAGLMALAVALRMNYTMRCLDLNIPANDPEFARLSQEILSTCIRNTELAQEQSTAKGIKAKVAAPILKSAVARNLETQQQQKGVRRDLDDILTSARASRDVLRDLVDSAERGAIPTAQMTLLTEVTEQARVAREQALEAVRARRMTSTIRNELLKLADELDNGIERSRAASKVRHNPFKRPNVEAALARATGSPSPSPRTSPLPSPARPELALSPPLPSDAPVTSPTFSLVDSDDSDDDAPVAPRSDPAMPIGLVPPALLIQSSDTQSEESSHDDGHESPPSPVDHRLEESEVFRRKAILDTHPELAELDESEATAGEELRKQILQADVPDDARSPRVLPADAPTESVDVEPVALETAEAVP